ncbi:MAG: cation:proton antiporter domain-containing protein [Bacteroidota bacterium]
MHGLLNDIGIAVLAATIVGFLSHRLRQPIILGYLIAGALIGPSIGFKLITDAQSIEVISELGLILLLFIIGLELNPQKIVASGKQLIVAGIGQFVLCVIIGYGFFTMIGFETTGGNLEGLYLALLCALSSTAIVVKILYDKFEADTIAGRITLGILIIQDIWAIMILTLQPNFSNPDVLSVLIAIVKATALLLAGFLISKYILRYMFESVLGSPELVVLISIGWCSLVASTASVLGLSKEMGALVAGISISTFPYSIHVTAKTLPLRDFFLTLFFISLGMKMVVPDTDMVIMGVVIVLFIIVSRFATLVPLLRMTGTGRRASFVTSLNLAQVSEFSLVIAALGVGYHHISEDLVSMLIFAMALSSILSSYAIKYNHEIHAAWEKLSRRIGLTAAAEKNDDANDEESYSIVFLGFHRAARALVDRIREHNVAMLPKILVIDFNTETLNDVRKLGMGGIFGDISSLDTLHHAHVDGAKMILSTIPDYLLKGTTNAKIVRSVRALAPSAYIVATADTTSQADQMKALGANEIVFPYEMVGDLLLHIVEKNHG